MVNYDKFNSIEDLYKRLIPVFHTKIAEFRREKITNITELDIWNYCIETKWKNKYDLRLYKMVDDILNIEYSNIIKFLNKSNKDDK